MPSGIKCRLVVIDFGDVMFVRSLSERSRKWIGYCTRRGFFGVNGWLDLNGLSLSAYS